MLFPILTVITFVPIVGAIFILLVAKEKEALIKFIGIASTFICFLLSVLIVIQYHAQIPGFQMQEKLVRIPALNVNYHLGIDGISVAMLFLTGLLTFLAAIASWNIGPRVKEYWVLYLLLETGMIGTFVSLDLFLFYVFWEVMLVPMYFLIGIWGGPRKEYAAIKFFLYTLAGSVFMLVGFLALYFASTPHSFSIPELAAQAQSLTSSLNSTVSSFRWGGAQLIFFLLFLGFAIKVPVFPFHTWLPDAHVEAPTPISVILAAILLKMGTYGFYRISFPILPQSAHDFALLFAILGIIGIIYGAFVAMAQQDFKKMVAYSSVSHMGFILLGLSAFTVAGWSGGYFQMFSHGILTGGLFLLVGVLYDRTHTRDLDAFGGLGARVPVYAGILTVISLGSLGLPGMSGFVSEFMVLLGAYKIFPGLTIIAVLGIVLTAGYILYMLQRVLLGPLNEKWLTLPEINKRELVTLVPLIIITIILGVYPSILLNLINPTITTILSAVGSVTPMTIAQSLGYFIPELVLLGFGFLVIILDLLTGNKKTLALITLAGLICSLWTITFLPTGSSLFFGMVTGDGFAIFFKLISILIVAVIVLMSIEYKQLAQKYAGEYYALLLFITVGMMLMASSTNLIMVYMSIEFVSLTSYILVGFLKRDIKSSESALKYFLFGALCSGVMLYGMSLLYGMTGNLELKNIAEYLNAGTGSRSGILLSILFILTGFGFKVAMVPFHMWVPDVYEGAPTPITAFLSVGSKGVGFAVLLRFFLTAFYGIQSDWTWLIGLLAVFTMSIGNLIAVTQENIKRLLAYSSIAQAGYILVGLAVATTLGQQSVLIYLFVYFLMNLGAFTVVIFISNALDSDMVSAYTGLGQRAPFLALALTLFLLSLTGIPPLAGFIGKLYIFSAAVQAKSFWLAVAVAVNSVVAAFYYFRIIRTMYLEEPTEKTMVAKPVFLQTALVITLFGTILIGIYPLPLLDFIRYCSLTMF